MSAAASGSALALQRSFYLRHRNCSRLQALSRAQEALEGWRTPGRFAGFDGRAVRCSPAPIASRRTGPWPRPVPASAP